MPATTRTAPKRFPGSCSRSGKDATSFKALVICRAVDSATCRCTAGVATQYRPSLAAVGRDRPARHRQHQRVPGFPLVAAGRSADRRRAAVARCVRAGAVPVSTRQSALGTESKKSRVTKFYPPRGLVLHTNGSGDRLVEHSASDRASGPRAATLVSGQGSSARTVTARSEFRSSTRGASCRLQSRGIGCAGRVLERADFVLGEEVVSSNASSPSIAPPGMRSASRQGPMPSSSPLTAAGVGPGDEVVTCAHTFIATASRGVACGATQSLSIAIHVTTQSMSRTRSSGP